MERSNERNSMSDAELTMRQRLELTASMHMSECTGREALEEYNKRVEALLNEQSQ